MLTLNGTDLIDGGFWKEIYYDLEISGQTHVYQLKINQRPVSRI